ncbi:hypothetical protein [Mucisphaera calidilacus]|uniref:Sensory transduction regulator n=1 Tax=Mucisphaera calidilacus TaxID=2527982 RepID=A0A518C030_9BACT|nr:hypothetical protein [Mucisphaera calidilacus]QDU72569.1 hypothetical protein Pan265_24390 [Mucisphaera calidilacus]
MTTTTASERFAAAVKPLADSGRFAEVSATADALTCLADGPEDEAWYIAHTEKTGVMTLGWYTSDRWLSESIEADLMHTGDDLGELFDEELEERDVRHKFHFEHFRDDEKRYVFRVTCPEFASDDEFVRTILALEACFRELGDMTPDED